MLGYYTLVLHNSNNSYIIYSTIFIAKCTLGTCGRCTCSVRCFAVLVAQWEDIGNSSHSIVGGVLAEVGDFLSIVSLQNEGPGNHYIAPVSWSRPLIVCLDPE
jgi:hypothetical protein